jgi:hypothetical protein
VLGVNDMHAYSLIGKQSSGHAAISTIISLTGDDDDGPPVQAAHHALGGSGDRSTSTTNQNINRCSRSDGFSVKNAHLFRGQHGAHN